MEKHTELTDSDFLKSFSTYDLQPFLFDHTAHLRLAWCHIATYGIRDTLEKLPPKLLLFVELNGAKDKYNVTLTVAAIKVVYHFVLKATSNTFADFIQEFPKLVTGFPDLLQTHYGKNLLASEKAKTEFLEPDLLPFDL